MLIYNFTEVTNTWHVLYVATFHQV